MVRTMAYLPSWFPEAKLGIFVHWGLFGTMYSEEGDFPGRKSRVLSPEEYRRRAGLFTCENFDMVEWTEKFRRWGARYAVLTARHSQGFPLWETAVEPERSVTRMSPCERDLVREWCEGLRQAGLKVGLYFCHRDWGDPDFAAVMDKEEGVVTDPAERERRWAVYRERTRGKLKELLSNYGRVDQLWVDENWGATAEELGTRKLRDLAMSLQPDLVTNGRWSLPWGMYNNPEQNIPVDVFPPGGTFFEVCDTLAESPHWQYLDCPRKYKAKEDVLRFFIDAISSGGNYLINIGPDWTGAIPAEEEAILDHLGDFVRRNEEAVYGTVAGLERKLYGGGSTQRPGALYLFDHERGKREMVLRGLRNEVVSVTRLDTGEPLPHRFSGGRPSHGAPPYIWIQPSSDPPRDGPVVVKITYKEELNICPW